MKISKMYKIMFLNIIISNVNSTKNEPLKEIEKNIDDIILNMEAKIFINTIRDEKSKDIIFFVFHHYLNIKCKGLLIEKILEDEILKSIDEKILQQKIKTGAISNNKSEIQTHNISINNELKMEIEDLEKELKELEKLKELENNKIKNQLALLENKQNKIKTESIELENKNQLEGTEIKNLQEKK